MCTILTVLNKNLTMAMLGKYQGYNGIVACMLGYKDIIFGLYYLNSVSTIYKLSKPINISLCKLKKLVF